LEKREQENYKNRPGYRLMMVRKTAKAGPKKSPRILSFDFRIRAKMPDFFKKASWKFRFAIPKPIYAI